VRSISKYLLAALVTIAVTALAVFVAVKVELLAGAVVVLGALVVIALIGRMRASRAEKAGMADWKDVLDADAPADAFFSDWTRTAPSTTPQVPDLIEPAWAAAADDPVPVAPSAAPVADASPAVEAPEEADAAFTAPDQSEVVSTAIAPTGTPIDADLRDAIRDAELDATDASDPTPSAFPFDDDGFGDLLPSSEAPAPGPDAEPAPDHVELAVTPPAAPAPHDSPFDVPGADLAEYFAPAGTDATAFADELTVTVSTGSNDPSARSTDRRPLIDWTGPTRIVEDRVRTSDDILAASAATALPTATVDRPAPAAGSELARLLSKVEARLRDYD
jgi:hypothetical protein